MNRNAFDADESTLTPDRRITRKAAGLDALYQERRGRMTGAEYGWCVLCGKNQVHAADGYDTCADCLAQQ